MSGGGGQWRAVRHYLWLGAEAERLLRRLRALADPAHKNTIWSRVLAGKEQEIDKTPSQTINKTPSQQIDKTSSQTIDKSPPRAVSAATVAASAAPVERLVEEKAAPEKTSPEKVASEKEAQEKAQENVVPEKDKERAWSPLSLQGLLQGLRLRSDLSLGKIVQPSWRTHPPTLHKGGLAARAEYLVSALAAARSEGARVRRVEELLALVYAAPGAAALAARAGAVRALLAAREAGGQRARAAAREALGALGVPPPPRGPGPRVLALDGGGVRGLVEVQLLQELERRARRPVQELFDYIIGVSTGAIIAALLATGAPLHRAADMYRRLSHEMFGNTSVVRGGARLVWSHAYYDTAAWERLLQDVLGDCTLGACARRGPALALVSSALGAPAPHVFRSYGAGGAARLWHAVRASAAAPTYFHEFPLAGRLHTDGGLACNNPAGLGLREARALYGPREGARAVLVSLGTGRAPPAAPSPGGSWRDKLQHVLASATDTQAVHELLAALLPARAYYRFNPPLRRDCAMDEADPARLRELSEDAAAYIRRNEDKFRRAAAALAAPRPLRRRAADYCRARAVIYGLRDLP